LTRPSPEGAHAGFVDAAELGSAGEHLHEPIEILIAIIE
jgi:hypothetical protein